MPARQAIDQRADSHRIGPDDPRYRAVVEKRFNKRFSASPDYVRLVESTAQVISAVEAAVRPASPAGGLCSESRGWVSSALPPHRGGCPTPRGGLPGPGGPAPGSGK